MMLHTQAYADSVCHMGVRNWKHQLHCSRNSCCIYPNVCGQCIINNSSGVQSPPCIFIPLFIDWCQNGACAIPWNESVLFILLIFWRENQFFYWLKRSLETKPSSTFKFVDILKRKSIAFCLLADVTYKNVTFEKRSHLSKKIATQTSSSQSQIESHWVQATYMCNAHFAPCSNAIILENISNLKHSLLCKYNPAVWQVVVPPA